MTDVAVSASTGGGAGVEAGIEMFARLAAAKRALAQDLKRDPATMARGLDPTYRLRPHLRVIGDALAGVLTGHTDRLLVITPPQVGKSTLVAEWGPFWWFTGRPVDDQIIASYAADLAETRSKRIQDLIREHGHEYGLALRTEAAHDWRLTSGGHLRAVGVGGGLSGFPGNVIWVDDPHADRAAAESPRIRNGVHDWWSSTASKRLQPDMGVVCAIMTRWHPDDWAGRRLKEEGRVEEGGRWKVIHLPAVADPRFGPDPLGREPGEPLTHPKIPTRNVAKLRAWWDEMKRTSIVRDWHSLAQGDPQPTEGALVSEDLLRMLRDTTTDVEPQKIAVAVDPSGGGRDVAGIVGGFLGDDTRLWITHDRSDVMSSADWAKTACLLAHETTAAVIYVETNYGGDMALLAIRTAWDQLVKEGRIRREVLPPQVKAVRARQGKLLRAEPVAQQMLLDRVRLRGLFIDLEREWATWQPTDPSSPGRIDASVYLAYGLLPIPAAGSAVAAGGEQMATTDLTSGLHPGDLGPAGGYGGMGGGGMGGGGYGPWGSG